MKKHSHPVLGFWRNHLVLCLVVITTLCLTLTLGIQGRAHANDCDANAIMHCGTGTASQFIAKVKANDDQAGHHDLQPIYAHYGLEPADYDRFVTSARPGTAYKDGRIVVDGLTVATNAKSVGRLASYQGSGSFSTSIAGAGTVYGNTNNQAFAAASIPVMVLFNAKGVVQFAVLTSCGNPIYGANNVPVYSCDQLHETAVANKPGTYSFTTDTTAGNGAHVVKLVYDFGDGIKVTATSPSQVIQHTYIASNSYTARVTVYVSLPGNQTVMVTATSCATIVQVALPFYQCVQLAAATIDNSKYKYQFIVTGKVLNGARITSADFNFGDGSATTGVGMNGQSATTTHTYAKDGAYQVVAYLHIALPGGTTMSITGPGCAKKVSVAIPYYNCVQLGGAILDKSNYTYSFVATADFGNGASFTSADFDFGDSHKTLGVVPTGTAATTTYKYGVAGNYRITATLYFTVNKTVQSVQCTATVTPTQPPTPECKPGVPQGSALCAPCLYSASLTATDTKCVPPNLPNTGAGSFVALFGAAVVAGFFIFRQYAYRKDAYAGAGADYSPEPSEVAPEEAVVVHPNRNHAAHKSVHTARYHQPHRFRPRSHREHDER